MRVDDREQANHRSGTSFKVKEDATLEALLARVMPGRSHSSVKKLLQTGSITVDGRVLRRLDEPLQAGQTVFVGKKSDFQLPPGLRIVWEDTSLLVVKKESGLLTVGNHSERQQTAEEYLNAYMQFRQQGERIYVVHRIDRDTSGILLFAKTSRMAELLRADWHRLVESRRYIAVAEGFFREPEGTVDTWMDEDARRSMMYVSRPGQGKRAVTHYRVLDERSTPKGDYSLLELQLETGRRNQIRVHMSFLGHPLAGDAKYGARTNPCGRLCLHAQELCFRHPITGERLEFTSEIPREFRLASQEFAQAVQRFGHQGFRHGLPGTEESR